jgi:pimeloyl-ACP methyl ester carboxylesterase
MKPQYRRVNGVKVRLAEGGKADGPLLLLLCPLPQSILAFDSIWQLLSDRFRLVALDLPGFGRSEGGLEFMTFEAQGKFLRAFIDDLGLDQVHIVGPDIGMAAALHYVIHGRHRAASLLIGDGPGIAPSHNGSVIDKMVHSGFWRMVFQIAGAGAFVEAANRLCYVNYVPKPEEVADYVASYDGRIGPVTQWFAKYPDSLATLDPHLAEIDLPVKIFWGQLDQLLFVDNGEHLHRADETQRSDRSSGLRPLLLSGQGRRVCQDGSRLGRWRIPRPVSESSLGWLCGRVPRTRPAGHNLVQRASVFVGSASIDRVRVCDHSRSGPRSGHRSGTPSNGREGICASYRFFRCTHPPSPRCFDTGGK